MAGRGRGRGRGLTGLSNPPKPGGSPSNNNVPTTTSPSQKVISPEDEQQKPVHPEQKRYTPPQFANKREPEVSKPPSKPAPSDSNGAAELSKILKDVDTMKKSQVLSEVPSAICKVVSQHSSEGESLMADFTTIICQKALKNPEFAMLGAQLCNALWISEKTGQILRKPLLSTVQTEYKKRNDLKRDQFYGLTVLLCELYKLLKVQGQSLKPLNNPVCELLKDLIRKDKIPDDDAFYFFQEIERVGDVIEKDNLDNMDEIINRTRDICISNDNILPSTRCRFVQLIEMRASKWRLSDQIRMVYDDLNQDLMATGR